MRVGGEHGAAPARKGHVMLKRSLLYYFVRDALKAYSEDFAVRDHRNPAVIELNGNSYSIHISYVHDSGEHRENEDEVRIQISRALIEQQRQRDDEGNKVAFIGFFEGGGETFVAWDPRHVFSLRAQTAVSVYARQSQETQAKNLFAAVHKFVPRYLPENTSFAIALPSYSLGFYIENIERFHRLRSENSIQSLLRNHDELLANNVSDVRKEFVVGQGEERERFNYTRKAYPRDSHFTRDVLAAYGDACCICDRQLGIVQAAHIIPHSIWDSPNDVTNGLALCVEHHTLYDDALLLPGPGFRLVFNSKRAEYLRQTKKERGLNEIAEREGKEFRVPDSPESRPSENYLRRGLDIRMDR